MKGDRICRSGEKAVPQKKTNHKMRKWIGENGDKEV